MEQEGFAIWEKTLSASDSPVTTDVEIDIPAFADPDIEKHLDWPAQGDLDLGEMVIVENLKTSAHGR